MAADKIAPNMAVLSWSGSGASATAATQKLASLTWNEETVEVESCGRSYWLFLQRARAIDNKQIGNVSAFRVDTGPEEEVRYKYRATTDSRYSYAFQRNSVQSHTPTQRRNNSLLHQARESGGVRFIVLMLLWLLA